MGQKGPKEGLTPLHWLTSDYRLAHILLLWVFCHSSVNLNRRTLTCETQHRCVYLIIFNFFPMEYKSPEGRPLFLFITVCLTFGTVSGT